MSSAPFDVGIARARVIERVPSLRSIGFGADFAAVGKLGDFPAPCGYVLLAAERGEAKPPGHASAGQIAPVRQMAMSAFGFATVVRNYRQGAGNELADELRSYVGQVRSALIGFVPPLPGARAIQWVSGRLEDYDASTALWVDVFQTQHSIGSATP